MLKKSKKFMKMDFKQIQNNLQDGSMIGILKNPKKIL